MKPNIFQEELPIHINLFLLYDFSRVIILNLYLSGRVLVISFIALMEIINDLNHVLHIAFHVFLILP